MRVEILPLFIGTEPSGVIPLIRRTLRLLALAGFGESAIQFCHGVLIPAPHPPSGKLR
jgi:hypothetical protein